MIVGTGVDIVSIARFAGMIERRPALVTRLFTHAESLFPDGRLRGPASLAARFAAKEAIAKALGAPAGLAWHDCEVVSDPSGRPWPRIRGTVAAASQECGITSWHLSLSHDGDNAIAQVIAEGVEGPRA
jgi:holo-[acyl-carrier protein] synthase